MPPVSFVRGCLLHPFFSVLCVSVCDIPDPPRSLFLCVDLCGRDVTPRVASVPVHFPVLVRVTVVVCVCVCVDLRRRNVERVGERYRAVSCLSQGKA